jgi:protein-L-isoaspartate(D-aspartate) O-methyltransferase
MSSRTPALALVLLGVTACGSYKEKPVPSAPTEDSQWTEARQAMVRLLRDKYGLRDEPILAAMTRMRRHFYVPEEFRRADIYGDHPCPIGHGQTISQPYIVAYMTGSMKIAKGEKILEIGTGSGYQAAILAELGADVHSIEIVPQLAEHARKILQSEGYAHVKVLAGDGYKGWPEHAPFDAIIVACAPEEIPRTLLDQLKDGGRMILPLGAAGFQRLMVLRKKDGRTHQEEDIPVRFVPMVHGQVASGETGRRDQMGLVQ